MSEKLPNMLESTIQKIREMVDVNSVVGEPIHTPDGVTIIPVSKVSVGFGGGGSDFVSSKGGENPFGGGVGGVGCLFAEGYCVERVPGCFVGSCLRFVGSGGSRVGIRLALLHVSLQCFPSLHYGCPLS